MNIAKTLLLVLLALPLLVLAAGQLGLFAGTPPQGLGVHDGRLKPPRSTPNCVHSQVAEGYPAIAPLALREGDGPGTIARIKAIVGAMPGVRIVEERPDYLYMQTTTRWLKFVDDTEFWFDPQARAIQVRSASRVGRRDFGVNRARVEAVRAALAAG